MMMENVNQHLDMPEDKTEAGLGDAEENLLWKPQNIQVQKISPSDFANDLLLHYYYDLRAAGSQDHAAAGADQHQVRGAAGELPAAAPVERPALRQVLAGGAEPSMADSYIYLK